MTGRKRERKKGKPKEREKEKKKEGQKARKKVAPGSALPKVGAGQAEPLSAWPLVGAYSVD